MNKLATFLAFFLFPLFAVTQTNILSTNTLAKEILTGNYDPADYMPSVPVNDPDELVQEILAGVSPDSLKKYIIKLASFGNRNTGADTVSTITGMGASRRWVFSKFQEYSTQNENRLITSYLQFDQNICGMDQHRNVIAVLPGTQVEDTSVVIIEGHMDSRCALPCDINCLAEGVEDNASGTALVMELARVMSKLNFSRTIVFMATIGEEQGLLGAEAFAQYAVNENIGIRAVLNNDVIGGIICGATSSFPFCPGEDLIDSTSVRLFSAGSFNSKHKSLARFLKLEYLEELIDHVAVPMVLNLQSLEDRLGRGGDHIPFRQKGFTAMRFTSAHEHGDAGADDPDYHDRQHTSDDILGVDTDGDMIIDSFFVDFNYLGRNAVINGVGAAMAAVGPHIPTIDASDENGKLRVEINDPHNYGEYKVGVRFGSIYFDTLFTLSGTNVGIFDTGSRFNSVTAATIDADGIESLFSNEIFVELDLSTATEEISSKTPKSPALLPNRPNPFDESTIISWMMYDHPVVKNGQILISNLEGKILKKIEVDLKKGLNEIVYTHGYGQLGTYVYSLVIGGQIIDSRKMVFAY